MFMFVHILYTLIIFTHTNELLLTYLSTIAIIVTGVSTIFRMEDISVYNKHWHNKNLLTDYSTYTTVKPV